MRKRLVTAILLGCTCVSVTTAMADKDGLGGDGLSEAIPGLSEAIPGLSEAIPGLSESLPGLNEALLVLGANANFGGSAGDFSASQSDDGMVIFPIKSSRRHKTLPSGGWNLFDVPRAQ